MRLISRIAALALGFCVSGTMASATLANNEPYPVEYWAAPAAMSNVQVSPDGKYVAFMTRPGRDANPVIEVYEVANLSAEPYRAGGESLEVTGFGWISDTQMTVSFRGQVSSRIDGFNQGAFRGRVAILDVEDERFTPLDSPAGGTGDFFSIGVQGLLPGDEDKILVSFLEFGRGGARRPVSYYEYNLDRGTRSLVLKGREDVGGVRFDGDGNPRAASGFDEASDEFIDYYRKPGDNSWSEVFRISIDSFESFTIAGYTDDPSIVYVVANNGNDRTGLYTFNVDTKQFVDLLYRHPEVDLSFMIGASNGWRFPDLELGVAYYRDEFERVFFNTEEAQIEKAFYDQLEGVIPNADFVTISSRSRDGNTLVVQNRGDKDPGTFYLIAGGQINVLGSANALLEASKLAERRYIQYPSRDGLTIPAFLHVPQGEGPFPLIVVPHGGPFIRETIIFDEWAQLLANNGYMVMQPQYRGSRGYGIDFYTRGFIPSGQGGYGMQDDKDDGVLYLIEQGLVDPDRVAMFGWSYGGYAALIAASRQEQLYQCVVSGAPVADNIQQVNYYRNQVRGAQRREQLPFWLGSINPINEVDKVNIPMLVVHGTIDQRVPISHARRYVAALERAGKTHRYIELENADHFFDTLTYDHFDLFYTEMLSFFENECGPGGL